MNTTIKALASYKKAAEQIIEALDKLEFTTVRNIEEGYLQSLIEETIRRNVENRKNSLDGIFNTIDRKKYKLNNEVDGDLINQ